jgi:hypothetical protein
MFRSCEIGLVLLFFVPTNQSQFVQAQFGTGPLAAKEAPPQHSPAIAEKASPCSGVPESAVTKGSFTVWTEPEDPKPGEIYKILVQIKVQADLEKFPICDISGSVTGTDGYKDHFGGPNAKGFLPVKNQSVRFEALIVPGAAELVKDFIQIKSQLLKEEQQLEIKF